MKKILFTIAVIAILAMFSNAAMAAPDKKSSSKKTNTKKSSERYSNPYKSGEINFNAGAGFGLAGMYGKMVIPPLSLSAEYNMDKLGKLPLSLGVIAGYASSVSETSYNTGTSVEKLKAEFTYFIGGARISYHYGELIKVSNLDLYIGAVGGYNYVKYKNSGSSDYEIVVDGSYPLFGGYAGARYFFTENIGLFTEFGYGVSYASAGLTFKF